MDSGKFLTIDFPWEVREALIWSVDGLLWYKYSHCGQFQITKLMSMKVNLGSDINTINLYFHYLY